MSHQGSPLLILDVGHFKVLSEFVIILLLFLSLASWLRAGDIRALQPGIEPHPCIAGQSLNHWTTRKGQESEL